jgi:DNA-binding NarL/FixJ family response regulator
VRVPVRYVVLFDGTLEADVTDSPGRTCAASVLIVDDHELVAQALARTLDVESDLHVVGHELTVAGAIEAARRFRPDLVLMDFGLPDGHGTDATAAIKREHPATEVVMLTGYADGTVLAAALESGCSGFVSKEGNLRDLAATIRGVLAGEVRVPQNLMAELAACLRPRPPTIGADLTQRELEVLALLAAGHSTEVLVHDLFLSVHTVRNHVRNILAKLHAQSRLEAVAIATKQGLLRKPAQPGRSA